MRSSGWLEKLTCGTAEPGVLCRSLRRSGGLRWPSCLRRCHRLQRSFGRWQSSCPHCQKRRHGRKRTGARSEGSEPHSNRQTWCFQARVAQLVQLMDATCVVIDMAGCRCETKAVLRSRMLEPLAGTLASPSCLDGGWSSTVHCTTSLAHESAGVFPVFVSRIPSPS